LIYILKNMHNEILTKEQKNLLPLIKSFSNQFGLVGGTAIALWMGHRQSIDFDLFTNTKFNNLKIRERIVEKEKIEHVFVDKLGEYTLLIKGVKITFFHYPYKIKFEENFNGVVDMANLLTLSALKAFALGRRAKWKDYVDIYFILKNYFHIKEVSAKAKQIFSSEFNEKLFRAQLAYFKDINYSEDVIYMKNFETSNELIKKELINFSLM